MPKQEPVTITLKAEELELLTFGQTAARVVVKREDGKEAHFELSVITVGGRVKAELRARTYEHYSRRVLHAEWVDPV